MNADEAREKAKQLSAAGKTHKQIAKILMAGGYRGPQGGTKLHASSICKLIKYGIKPRGRGAAGAKAATQARRAEPAIAASTYKTGETREKARHVIKAAQAILDLEMSEVLKMDLLAALFEGAG